MSQNSCCVSGCQMTTKDGVTLHRFPNPAINVDRFNIWVSNIGGDIAELDADVIFGNRRVCSRHFEDIHKYAKNRLSRIAVPLLHLKSDQEPVLYETKAITMPVLATTIVSHKNNSQSNPADNEATYSNALNSDHEQHIYETEVSPIPILLCQLQWVDSTPS